MGKEKHAADKNVHLSDDLFYCNVVPVVCSGTGKISKLKIEVPLALL